MLGCQGERVGWRVELVAARPNRFDGAVRATKHHHMLAELADEDVDDLGGRFVTSTIEGFQDEVLGQRLAAVVQEQSHHVRFHTGEFNFRPVESEHVVALQAQRSFDCSGGSVACSTGHCLKLGSELFGGNLVDAEDAVSTLLPEFSPFKRAQVSSSAENRAVGIGPALL